MPFRPALAALAFVSVTAVSMLPANAGRHPLFPRFDDRGTIEWYTSLPDAQAAAEATGKLIFVESGRLECPNCVHVVSQVIPSPALRARFAAVAVGLAVDCDDDRPDARVEALLSSGLPDARMLPLCGFMTANLRWVTGFSGFASEHDVADHLTIAEQRLRFWKEKRAANCRPPETARPGPALASAAVPAPSPRPTPQPAAAPPPPPPPLLARVPQPTPAVAVAPRPPLTVAPDPSPLPRPVLATPAPVPAAPAPAAPAPALASAPKQAPASPPAVRSSGLAAAQPSRAIVVPSAPKAASTSPLPPPARIGEPARGSLAVGGGARPAPPTGNARPAPKAAREVPSSLSRAAAALAAQSRRAATDGRWGEVLRCWEAAADLPRDGDVIEMENLASRARNWSMESFQAAADDAAHDRFEKAFETLASVRREMNGRVQEIDAERGERAVERLSAIVRGDPDVRVDCTLEARKAYAEFRGTRWASLFKAHLQATAACANSPTSTVR